MPKTDVQTNEEAQPSNDTWDDQVSDESNSPIKPSVDRLLDLAKGQTPKFNRKQGLSVIDLDYKHTGQGIRYRQLFVHESPGFMEISLKEGVKSNNGGTDQSRTLGSFRVPISDFNQYSRIQKRFFGFAPTKNVNDATLLLDALERTVKTI